MRLSKKVDNNRHYEQREVIFLLITNNIKIASFLAMT